MATTLLVVGDVAGHLTALDEVLAPFDVCVSESEVPAGTVVVQVGDLIGRSDESARLIACVDRLHNRAPDRWVQLVGNHESRGPLRHRPGAAARRRSHRRSPDHGHRPRPGQGWACALGAAGPRRHVTRVDGQPWTATVQVTDLARAGQMGKTLDCGVTHGFGTGALGRNDPAWRRREGASCPSARGSRASNPGLDPHVDGPRVAHPVARLENEIECAGRDSLRERNALTSLFASPCAQRDTSSEFPRPCVGGSNPPGGAAFSSPTT
jgi:hypothetical protein